jgi:hypothetical protein
MQLYHEPHLQRKSDKCAALWREWYNYKYGLRDYERAERTRERWRKCCDDFEIMLNNELKTNPRYNNGRYLLREPESKKGSHKD